MALDYAVRLEDIRAAQDRIAQHTIRTPLIHSQELSQEQSQDIWLKLEHLQKTGSFKLRGATNAILGLTPAQKAKGVVGVSTGNHGRGLAYAARQNGVRCIICMSSLVPENKVKSIKQLGAEVRIVGASQDDAQSEVDALVRQGMTMLPPFDHPAIIAGQGTIGLELFDALSDIHTVLVPVSGGGLVSGVALALKSLNPNIDIIGVTMERGAAMHASLKAGHPVLVKELPTLADSLGGGIGLNNAHTFKMTSSLVKEIILVSEAEIAEAISYAYWSEKQIIEGSGSVCLAALRSGKINAQGPTVALLTGANLDMQLHHDIISGNPPDMTSS